MLLFGLMYFFFLFCMHLHFFGCCDVILVSHDCLRFYQIVVVCSLNNKILILGSKCSLKKIIVFWNYRLFWEHVSLMNGIFFNMLLQHGEAKCDIIKLIQMLLVCCQWYNQCKSVVEFFLWVAEIRWCHSLILVAFEMPTYDPERIASIPWMNILLLIGS